MNGWEDCGSYTVKMRSHPVPTKDDFIDYVRLTVRKKA